MKEVNDKGLQLLRCKCSCEQKVLLTIKELKRRVPHKVTRVRYAGRLQCGGPLMKWLENGGQGGHYYTRFLQCCLTARTTNRAAAYRYNKMHIYDESIFKTENHVNAYKETQS